MPTIVEITDKQEILELGPPDREKASLSPGSRLGYWSDVELRAQIEAIRKSTAGGTFLPSARDIADLWTRLLSHGFLEPASQSSCDGYRIVTRRFRDGASQMPLPYVVVDLVRTTCPMTIHKETTLVRTVCQDMSVFHPEPHMTDARKYELACVVAGADKDTKLVFVIAKSHKLRVWFFSEMDSDAAPADLCSCDFQPSDVLSLSADHERVEAVFADLRIGMFSTPSPTHSEGPDKEDEAKDTDRYDEDGYDELGFDRDGYDRDGYDSDGFDNLGWDAAGYDLKGFNEDGFDRSGYNKDGFTCDGYDRNGLDKDGFDKYGYDRNGFDKDGYGEDGFTSDGYDRNGFYKDGYNKHGFDKDGRYKDGHKDDSEDGFTPGEFDTKHDGDPEEEDAPDCLDEDSPKAHHEENVPDHDAEAEDTPDASKNGPVANAEDNDLSSELPSRGKDPHYSAEAEDTPDVPDVPEDKPDTTPETDSNGVDGLDSKPVSKEKNLDKDIKAQDTLDVSVDNSPEIQVETEDGREHHSDEQGIPDCSEENGPIDNAGDSNPKNDPQEDNTLSHAENNPETPLDGFKVLSGNQAVPDCCEEDILKDNCDQEKSENISDQREVPDDSACAEDKSEVSPVEDTSENNPEGQDAPGCAEENIADGNPNGDKPDDSPGESDPSPCTEDNSEAVPVEDTPEVNSEKQDASEYPENGMSQNEGDEEKCEDSDKEPDTGDDSDSVSL
ncbi:uncharacterized protein BO97DRAFT_447888 [Aspergillus homomorphus CBS 101889]|uniref:Uncharacterized protein n=1 Tax=Aspergillus homomorphus (strain CBS 101889) TaxID=1450537 RepID=A0A395IBR3_ASPHC|nr:hypothetical protein BO97DRAFT_447888 [Aspergillus homomorphus CBS 101889]RAL17471.1 hypothetical protein BO97DRAFT_447888 [Aspergillus homomorphus CBS 101889]